jgi:urease accessory protein
MRGFMKYASATVAWAAMLMAQGAALAHEGAGAAGGVLSGFSHPFSGWDHIIAMIAVGLWGALLGAPAIWMLPITFLLMMAVGGFLGLIGVALPGVEIGIAVSAIVLGLAVAAKARLMLTITMAVVAAFAVFHGHAHGTELAVGANALAYSLGFVVATGLLHVIGIAIGTLRGWRVGEWAIRTMGTGVAAAGLVFLVRAVG